jgi:hypothetical protein
MLWSISPARVAYVEAEFAIGSWNMEGISMLGRGSGWKECRANCDSPQRTQRNTEGRKELQIKGFQI